MLGLAAEQGEQAALVKPSPGGAGARKEHPLDGESFDVLWAKFEFEDMVWDDEMMWDIRYLLMGSKLDKVPGFPASLNDLREKLYVTRDGISERGRKAMAG